MGKAIDTGGLARVLRAGAEKVKAVLPPERLWITLRHLDETKRGLLMEATGQRYEELLREFRRVAFGV